MRPRHLMLALLPLAAGLPAAAHAEGWCLGAAIRARYVAHFANSAGLSVRDLELAYKAHLQKAAPQSFNWVNSGNVECGTGSNDRNNTLEGGNTGQTVAVGWQPSPADLEAGRAEKARLEAAQATQATQAQPTDAPAQNTDAQPAQAETISKARKLLKSLTDKIPR
ncbi:hypothetical protein QE438_002471 [Pseudoxanthomonas sp. SORGH_AS 997]|uniref:Uncharacterized protein n=2 Tax=Lysobacteraceae TaxID=32033 RepID=A0AAW8GJR0_9GAMM|nr:hypothetical protein [Pseudoxanthomonas winnipegensis]MDQ1134603.1 hypothetical protein [Pseudoxanthomonas winnipegensis]MDR6139167.1 hypothetical protein [Pseudoxanthomonas sp. SORGH_AS_0997]